MEIIGGEKFVMRFAPGETHDHLLIWLPDRKTLFAADNIYRAFPNLYAIRGVPPRPIRGWIDSLDDMRRLDPAPELLILGHGAPVLGKQEIYELLTDYRDAIGFVHDSVVRGMNAGLGPDELAESIELPKRLRDHPYLKQTYGTIAASVRAIYHGYVGWLDGDAANLRPVPETDQARWIVDAFGGKDQMLKKIDEASGSGETAKALWLVHTLTLAHPKFKRARLEKASLIEKSASSNENPLMRNWMLTEAADLKSTALSIQKPKINGETVSQIPIERLFRLMPARLNPKRSAKMNLSYGFDITDLDLKFTFIIRAGVGELAPGIVGTPRLTIRGTDQNIKRIFLAGEGTPLKRDFWTDMEMVIPEKNVHSPFRGLLRLARLAAVMIKP